MSFFSSFSSIGAFDNLGNHDNKRDPEQIMKDIEELKIGNVEGEKGHWKAVESGIFINCYKDEKGFTQEILELPTYLNNWANLIEKISSEHKND